MGEKTRDQGQLSRVCLIMPKKLSRQEVIETEMVWHRIGGRKQIFQRCVSLWFSWKMSATKVQKFSNLQWFLFEVCVTTMTKI